MSPKTAVRSFEDVVAWLKDHGFEVLEAPATAGRVFLKKHGCSAAIERNPSPDPNDPASGTRIFAKPGFLLGGEIAMLVDKGYQKFLKTSKSEIAATADHLKAIHAFGEELREAMQATSLYNQSLGTVSDSYMYDRVTDRDTPEQKRPQRPWEKVSSTKKPA